MVGRKWKYRALVEVLEDDELYNVAKIIRRADALNLFERDLETDRVLVGEDKKAAMRNARSALANMAALRLKEHDGEIEVLEPYRAFYRAWYGKTWKALV